MDTEAREYAFIDCHHHIRIGDLVGADGSGPKADRMQQDLVERRQMMERNNIASTVLMPSFDYDKGDGLKSTEQALDCLLQYQAMAPELFPWVMCTVEPYFYDRGVKQLDALLGSGIYSGVTWHNRYHGLPADAPIMFKLVEVAVQHDLPILLHAAGNTDHEEAYKVAKLVRRFPEGKFVILDAMLNGSSMNILTALLLETDTVWLDIANALPVMRIIERAGMTAGWDRVLLGSCFYSQSHSNTICSPLEEFLTYDIDPKDRRAVLRDNLLRILGAPA